MHSRRTEPGHAGDPQMHVAIERIYRAGMGDVDWGDAISMLVRTHGAEGAMLFTPEVPVEAGGLSVSIDINARAGLQAVPVPGDLPKSSTGRAFSCVLAIDGDESLPATLFLLFRAESSPPLEEHELDAIQLCCRHLAIAVRLWYRERFSRHGSEMLAASINAAALIAAEDGSIRWMNRRAEMWMRDRRVIVEAGRLVELPELAFDVRRALREAAQKGSKLSIRANGSMTAEIQPVPAPQRGAPGGAGKAALVILRDRSGCRDAAAALASNFRLTATEVDLAIALSKGVLIAEYAAQRSVAMSTVRTQLKSLLAKTGARRQSDVVAIVARLHPISSGELTLEAHHRHPSNG